MATDFGGLSVAELTQALKDGILDPSALRSVLASITNPLATLADAVAAGGLTLLTDTETGGELATTSGSFVDQTDSEIAFSLAGIRDVLVIGMGSTRHVGGGNLTVTAIGLNMTAGPGDESLMTVGPDNVQNNVIPWTVVNLYTALASGAHTAKLIFRRVSGTDSARVSRDAVSPTKLFVIHSP